MPEDAVRRLRSRFAVSAADFRRNRIDRGTVHSIHDLDRGAEDVARAALRHDKLRP
jgi:hypothetical protein